MNSSYEKISEYQWNIKKKNCNVRLCALGKQLSKTYLASLRETNVFQIFLLRKWKIFNLSENCLSDFNVIFLMASEKI